MSVFTRSRRRSIMGTVALLGAGALVLAGCSSDPGTEGGDNGGNDDTAAFTFPVTCSDAAPTAYTPTYSSTSTGPATDLTLTVGTSIPTSGNLAFLGPPEVAGTEYAAAEVNEAGKGVTVNLIQGDSGDTDNKAYETEVPRVLGEGATAIIGAAASGVSLQIIDQVIAANAVMISPANTSATFTGYEDNGLYWRTAPSDVLQGEVLGNLIASEGNETLGFIIVNDSYGTGLACFTKESFEAAGGEVVSAALYNTGDSNFTSQVEDVLAADPDAIALVTFDEVNTIVPELLSAEFPAEKLYFVDGNLTNFGEDLPADSLTGAKGTYPAVDPASIATFRDNVQEFWTGLGNEPLNDFTYGPEAYDALILLALAALEAGSAAGPDLAAHLQQVSGGSGDGTKCTSFAECADIIIGGGVADYDGASGPITYNEVGDPTEASIGIFQYGSDNNNTFLRIG